MTSLEIIRSIIINNKLESHTFELVAHRAEINWRQKFESFREKINNIESGILFDEYEPIKILGEVFLEEFALDKFITNEAPILSISSRVTDRNSNIVHLPLMNLHLDYYLSKDQIFSAINRIAHFKFHLVTTDRYFHVYGERLINEIEWKEWNIKFLMVDALVSPRYVGHSLQRGFNLLRLNSTKAIKKNIPYVLSDENSNLSNVRLFALIKHGNQKRRSGQMYFIHLFEVEEIAKKIISELELKIDSEFLNDILSASLLHDTIEDTYTDFEDLVDLCNFRVATFVSLLSNDKRIPSEERQIEYKRRLKQADIYVHIIKLADIYSNLKGLSGSEGKEWIESFAKKSRSYMELLNSKLHATSVYNESQEIINKILI